MAALRSWATRAACSLATTTTRLAPTALPPTLVVGAVAPLRTAMEPLMRPTLRVHAPPPTLRAAGTCGMCVLAPRPPLLR
jgi:hypothetical protein